MGYKLYRDALWGWGGKSLGADRVFYFVSPKILVPPRLHPNYPTGSPNPHCDSHTTPPTLPTSKINNLYKECNKAYIVDITSSKNLPNSIVKVYDPNSWKYSLTPIKN